MYIYIHIYIYIYICIYKPYIYLYICIALKEHKGNFKSNQKCRLINPSKSEMGIVSKEYLENIISKLNSRLQYN